MSLKHCAPVQGPRLRSLDGGNVHGGQPRSLQARLQLRSLTRRSQASAPQDVRLAARRVPAHPTGHAGSGHRAQEIDLSSATTARHMGLQYVACQPSSPSHPQTAIATAPAPETQGRQQGIKRRHLERGQSPNASAYAAARKVDPA